MQDLSRFEPGDEVTLTAVNEDETLTVTVANIRSDSLAMTLENGRWVEWIDNSTMQSWAYVHEDGALTHVTLPEETTDEPQQNP